MCKKGRHCLQESLSGSPTRDKGCVESCPAMSAWLQQIRSFSRRPLVSKVMEHSYMKERSSWMTFNAFPVPNILASWIICWKYIRMWESQPTQAICVVLTSNPGQQGQLQIHAMKFVGNSLNSSGWGISSSLSKIKDVQFHQRIPVNMEKKSKGGVCLQRPHIWSSDIVCLLFFIS